MIQLFVLACGSPICFFRDLRGPWGPGRAETRINPWISSGTEEASVFCRNTRHSSSPSDWWSRGKRLRIWRGTSGSDRRDDKANGQPNRVLETGPQLTDRPLRRYGWKSQNREFESASSQQLSASSQTSVESGRFEEIPNEIFRYSLEWLVYLVFPLIKELFALE